MLMKRREYQVVTKHSNGYMDGTHVLEVTQNANGTYYVKGRGFGCSRDYNVSDPTSAILELLSENAMQLINIKQV